MKLLSFGCSFILGTDLGDLGPSYQSIPGCPNNQWVKGSRLAWPALIAKKLNLDYECCAFGGRGNLTILDRVLNHLPDPDAIFVIQWTYIDRFDYSQPGGEHHTPFGAINDWQAILPGQQSELSDLYYRQLHSEYRDKLASLCYINTAISTLRAHSQRFVMFNIDDLIWCRRWNTYPGMRPGTAPAIPHLQDLCKEYIHDFDGKNFLDWSRKKNFAISPNAHPLEEAHQAAADLVSPIIESILHTT